MLDFFILKLFSLAATKLSLARLLTETGITGFVRAPAKLLEYTYIPRKTDF